VWRVCEVFILERVRLYGWLTRNESRLFVWITLTSFAVPKTLHNLTSTPSIIRKIRPMCVICSKNWGDCVGKPEGKRTLEEPRRRWLDIIQIVHRGSTAWYGLD
jgi:hypothetical protein